MRISGPALVFLFSTSLANPDHTTFSVSLLFFFFFFNYIYLGEREQESTHTKGEADSLLSRESSAGLSPRTPRP